MPADFTLLHVAAGRPLKWPTYLTLSADCMLTREGDTATSTITLLDRRDKMLNGALYTVRPEPLLDGAYLLRQGYIATDPLRCYVGPEGCLRFVPEEINGSDPTCETLPWAKALLNGIGVVTEACKESKKVVIEGLSFLGKEQRWCKYKARLFAAETVDDPLLQFPRILSLASFHAFLHRVGRDGVIEGRLQRISYLQPAFSLLLGELGIIPGQLGKDRAIAALRRLNQDQQKVQRLVNAVEESSADSEDTPSVEEVGEDGVQVDRYGRKRVRMAD
ncbi:hypothetical protein OC834_005618 [Tilletia horrida]|nr:hypothetical protein OC834_005618 [Tilletia horrida]KAK0557656.1 hypothetical protein OC844_005525 [Tilletia horrida]